MKKEEFDQPCLWKKSEKKKMDLKEGEDVCQCCNGWGMLYDTNRDYILQCKHCQGDGKLDWIENVTGKKYNDEGFLSGSSGRFSTSGFGASTSGYSTSYPLHIRGKS